METYLSLSSPLVGLFLIFGTILMIIFFCRYYINIQSRKNLKDLSHFNNDILSRTKYQDVNTFRMSGPLFRVGLALSISVCLLAFNWTQDDLTNAYSEYIYDDMNEIDVLPPPITDQKPPPPPPPVLEIIADDKETIDEVFVDQSPDIDDYINEPPSPVEIQEADVPPPPPPPPPPILSPEIFTIVEQMPRFPGCEDMIGSRKEKSQCANGKLMKYIMGHIKYPAMARENGIRGTVTVQFVVNEEGGVDDIVVLRDPGGGLGKEALRVANKMAANIKWTPGKQRGRAVKVKFTLPIKFRLD